MTHLKLRDLWDKKSYDLKESDLDIAFTPPVLYDMYEKQKMTEATFAIYKAYTDNDEMSKSLAMKNVLGWTDDQIKENFMALIKDKQMVAVADYFAEKISDENAPVDFKSPIKLKSDVEKKEKIFSGSNEPESSGESAGGTEGEGTGAGAEPAGEAGGEEAAEGEEEPAEAPTPTFGLG